MSIDDDLIQSLDDILAWAAKRPSIAATRIEVLSRLSSLTPRWAEVMMKSRSEIDTDVTLIDRVNGILTYLCPVDTVADGIRVRLALEALLMIETRQETLGGNRDERVRAALEVASHLVG